MTTIPRDDMLAKIGDRTEQEYFEKFKRETLELARQQREAKERRDVKTSTADKPLQTAEAPT